MSGKATLLVADDARSDRESLARFLRARDFGVVTARNSEQALRYLQQPVDLVIAEPRMLENRGWELLRRWKERCPSTPLIIATADGNVQSAVTAMKLGAADYLGKPINPLEMLHIVHRCLDPYWPGQRAPDCSQRRGWPGFDKLVGCSAPMVAVFERIEQAAQSECTVIVTGESGTGKELVAQALHRSSPRGDGPFLVANMAAVPEMLIESELFGHVHGAFTGAIRTRMGRFEAAHGGTLFIDEIGDLQFSCQAKLLRVLENHRITPVGSNDDRKVDVRVVAATNRDLRQMVAQRQFREDLYYRLNVVTIRLPPLRERREDIPLLVECFLDEFCGGGSRPRRVPDAELLEFLKSYDWPGNVRQLHNCIESMVVLASSRHLTLQDLPASLRDHRTHGGHVKIPRGCTLAQVERLAVEHLLDRYQGNRLLTAQALGISVRTLQRKLNHWKDPAPAGSSSA